MLSAFLRNALGSDVLLFGGLDFYAPLCGVRCCGGVWDSFSASLAFFVVPSA